MAGYLIQRRGGGFAFCMAVPKSLVGQFKSRKGKPLTLIVKGLRTDSARDAAKRAAIMRAEWLLKFEEAAKANDMPAWNQRPIISGDGRLRFGEAAELHLAELCRDPGAAPRQQTIQQARAIHNLFWPFVENAPINSITRAQANDFLTHMAKERGLSNRTLNQYAMTLAAVFRWARDAGKLDGTNPFERRGFKEPKGQGWVAYTSGELNKLVTPKPGNPLAWSISIALWSGCRLNEIAGMEVQDVRQEQGVWIFDIRENAARRLKTHAATRLIPIHSALIKAGLLAYAQTLPAGPLFPSLTPGGPDAKPGKYLGERFTRWRRTHGVVRERVSFHSLRKNFASALDRAGVPIADASALLGHGRGFSWDVYSSGPGLKRLRKLVEQVSYPGL
jgi:integrase